MSKKSILQLADEWISGFLDRQEGRTFSVVEICRIAFQAGYVSAEQCEEQEPDFQEQIEAMNQYMEEAQHRLIILKDAMLMLLDAPAIAAAIGQNSASELKADLLRNRRTTFDDLYQKYIKVKY